MQLDPPRGSPYHNFLEGIRTGVAQTEDFRVYPSTYEEAVDIVFDAEYNFIAARFGAHWQPSIRSTGISPWTSVMRMMKKTCFKLWNSNLTSVDVTRAEAQSISALTVHCVNRDRIGRAVLPLQTRNMVRHGKTSTPGRHEAPYWRGTRLCKGSRR